MNVEFLKKKTSKKLKQKDKKVKDMLIYRFKDNSSNSNHKNALKINKV